MIGKIYVEISCLNNYYTGIGKTITILLDSLNQLGYNIEKISPDKFNTKPSLIYYNYIIPRFCQDTLHSDDIFLIPNNMGKFLRLPHRRTWVMMHDLIPLSKYGYIGFKRILYKFKIKQIKYAERIIAISNYVKKDLCDKIGISEQCVKVLYWPITIPKISQVERNPNQFLGVGTGEPRKCVETLIENWNYVSPKKSILLLYGGEWKKGISHSKLRKIIEENNLNSRVFLLGRVSDDELSMLYASSQAFIYTSLEEGFGLPPLEALSLGCNIVLPKTPINFELYGSIGFLYSSGDKEQLKEAIAESTISNENHNFEFSQQFSIEEFMKSIKKVFDK